MRRLLGVLLTLVSFQCFGAIVFQEGWDAGPYTFTNGAITGTNVMPSCGCYYKADGQPYNSFERSTKYKRNGTHSLRIEDRTADRNQICAVKSCRTQPDQNGNPGVSRSELEFAAPADRSFNGDWTVAGAVVTGAGYVARNEEVWFGTSYYFPSNEGTHNGNWWNLDKRFMIGQLFAMGHSATPEVETVFSNKRLGGIDLQSRYSLNPTGETPWYSNPTKQTVIAADQWNDFVYHWKRSANETGFLTVWLNGTQIYSVTGPVALLDKPYAIFKAGLYPSTLKAGSIIVVYVDGHVIGDASSSYTEIQNAMNGTPGSLTPKPPTSLNAVIQ